MVNPVLKRAIYSNNKGIVNPVKKINFYVLKTDRKLANRLHPTIKFKAEIFEKEATFLDTIISLSFMLALILSRLAHQA